VPPCTLAGDLAGLLGRGERADLVVRVGGEDLHAHAAVVAARVPLLRTQLRQTASPRLLEIADVSASSFRVLLTFIYTDTLPVHCVEEHINDSDLRVCHCFVLVFFFFFFFF
jgi:hypothetical protein